VCPNFQNSKGKYLLPEKKDPQATKKKGGNRYGLGRKISLPVDGSQIVRGSVSNIPLEGSRNSTNPNRPARLAVFPYSPPLHYTPWRGTTSPRRRRRATAMLTPTTTTILAPTSTATLSRPWWSTGAATTTPTPTAAPAWRRTSNLRRSSRGRRAEDPSEGVASTTTTALSWPVPA
jgi:hypothetical protein